jgi:TRAP-type mannitol/chloroaromatic compound transport system permease small subunit
MSSAATMSENRDDSVMMARMFAWGAIALMFAYLINNYLTAWRGWPGASAAWHGGPAMAWAQLGIYALFLITALLLVIRTPTALLRPDSERIYALTSYIIRASFWAVLLIGLADGIVSFLRVENVLQNFVGDTIAADLGRSNYRGVYLHFPMLILSLLIALVHRGLGFIWLSLLVVVAELLIVLSRFIFSYEQAFMSDLVRFWYAALFLFASAYTLIEEGHVRVDVLYASMSQKTRGLVNALGSIFLGLSFCVVIIMYGMGNKSSVINGPLLVFETTQAGFGMFVKYWMAGFLAIFAISMLIQFMGFFLEGVADYRDEPGKRAVTAPGGH